jgi:cell division protein FtsB
MKRRTSHATRSPLGLPRRRRPAPAEAVPLTDRVAGLLRLSGRSALSLALGALMLVFIGLLVANFIGQIMQAAALEARREELAAEVAQMEADNATLRGAVEFSESDVYIERVAREQLGYAREGDVVILPRELPAAAPAAPAADEQPAAPAAPAEPNWRLWWQALFPPAA